MFQFTGKIPFFGVVLCGLNNVMIKKTIELYEYSELKPEAKEKALKNYKENDFDEFSLRVHLDNEIEELLQKYGIVPIQDLKGYETKYAKVYYSLSHCQGDGVMFEGVFSFPTETEKEGEQWKRYVVTVKQSGRYSHSNSKTVEVENDNEVVAKEFEQVYQKICKELEQSGYKHIEELQSEAYFIEECNANEWTFREDGTRENL